MALPSNPATLANYDITKAPQAKTFAKAVSDLFQSLSNQITTLLLSTSSLFYKSVDLGTITGSQTVDCAGAVGVSVSLGTGTAATVTLNLTHLALGVPVTLTFGNSSGVAVGFVIRATQPGGTAYTSVLWKTSTGAFNMTTTGITVPNGTTFIAEGSAVPSGSWNLNMVAN
jgi:hypothetical protein